MKSLWDRDSFQHWWQSPGSCWVSVGLLQKRVVCSRSLTSVDRSLREPHSLNDSCSSSKTERASFAERLALSSSWLTPYSLRIACMLWHQLTSTNLNQQMIFVIRYNIFQPFLNVRVLPRRPADTNRDAFSWLTCLLCSLLKRLTNANIHKV